MAEPQVLIIFSEPARKFKLAPELLGHHAHLVVSNAVQGEVARGLFRQQLPWRDLLHETAASWLRHRLSRSTPAKWWQESREEYGRRLKRCCEEVNKECNVEGLCKGLPERMKLLQEADGDRLKK